VPWAVLLGWPGVVRHAVAVGRRDPSYREINDDWVLQHGLVPAILYDVIAFPFRVAKKRTAKRKRRQAEQAQKLKRETRRLRRASARGTRSPKKASR
jgi:hypothetical protein